MESKTEPRSPFVKNLTEVDSLNMTQGKKFGGFRKRLAAETGSKELGCSWYELPPNRQAFPHHYHFGNEEAFFILSGKGELRLGEKIILIGAGDFVACPPGAECSHSITNTSEEPLRYLGISTSHSIDAVVYPDSRKFAVVAGADMQKGLRAAPFIKLLKDQPNVDYYLDEE